ncbi:MAG: arylsulfatase [Flavobacteriaceae bacterium]|jgi:arylsulfatase|nr:arylsulfatase [Flavobacteriaceae bacterium]MBT6448744.1 arylsulfatase [Flavobacteriaceae bacterium]MDG1830145.1 arylsulfatase [Flavobacteriaceae bacterium]
MKKILAFIIFSCILFSCNNKEIDRPNVILIITDDQGFGDIGYNGNTKINTPNLDNLANESIRFNNFYVSPVCAPTRSSLMTGRYSLRTGVRDTYNGGAIMSSDEITIPEVLKEANYKTGIFGKWHLGDNYPSRPSDQGFDESLIHLAGGIGQVGDITNYFQGNKSYFDPILWLNNKKKKYDGYCSDIFTNEAINFVDKNKSERFFCYLSFNAPHTPLQLPKKYYEMYKDLDPEKVSNQDKIIMSEKDIEDAKKVYGMVSNIDDNIGRLLKKLDELGISDNTIVIFMTDNGPQQRRYISGLRGLKSDVYNGGIKVPFYLRYPRIFTEGQDTDVFSAHIDVLPTISKLCGLNLPDNRIIDGIDLLSNIKKQNRSFFSYWTRRLPELYNNVSVQKGDYKLVGNTDYNSPITDFELFDITKDPYEKNNLIEIKKTKASMLKIEMDSFYNNLIKSKNLIDQPRIIIGTEFENPTILNRNDAGGERGIWAQNEIYGFWRIKMMEGKYNFKFKFININQSSGEMLLEIGNKTFKKSSIVDNEGYISMNDININKGNYNIIPTFKTDRKNILPFWIEVNKI